jgi:hypothetical protein
MAWKAYLFRKIKLLSRPTAVRVSNFWESMASVTNSSFAHLSFASDCLRTIQGDEI